MASNTPDAFIGGLIERYERLRDELHPKSLGRARAVVVQEMEAAERDLAAFIAPSLADIAHDPAISQTTRDAVATMIGPEHQSQLVIVAAAAYALIREFISAAVGPYVQEVSNAAWKAAMAGGHEIVPLSPAEITAAVLKGVLSETDAATHAAASGVGPQTLSLMVQASGQAIGIEQALLLYRRKQIPLNSTDPAHPGLIQVLQYSNMNPRFYGLPELLAYVPLSVGEVVTANLKGHLSDATAVTMLQEAGIDGAKEVAPGVNMQQLLRAASGRPPGTEQMLQLRNHFRAGLITTSVTDADVAAAVRQSDINDAYLPFIMELGHYFPPPRSIVPMLRSGAINETQARRLLNGYGVDTEWQDAFVKEATKASSTTVKELSASMVTRSYEMGLLPRADALLRIEALGHNAADAALYLDLADTAKMQAQTNAAIGRIRNRYVRYVIDKPTALADMARLGLQVHTPAEYLAIWDLDREANTPALSNASWQGALHRGIVTVAQFIGEMRNRGYSGEEIWILGYEAFPPTKAPPPDVVSALSAISASVATGERAT